MITTTYKGREYTVPNSDHSGGWDDLLTEIPDDDHAMAYLMQDGNFDVPAGRYGRDTAECAPIALMLAKILQHHSGEPMTYYALDSDMGLVVNGSDSVGFSLWRDGHVLGDDFDVSKWLDATEIHAAEQYQETND